MPVLPLRPATPRLEGREVETPTKAPKAKGFVEVKRGAEAKEKVEGLGSAVVKEDGVQTGKGGEGAAKGKAPAEAHGEQLGEKKAVEEKQTVAPGRKTSAPQSFQPASKGQATVQASDAKAAPVSPTKPDSSKTDAQKRKHPGRLDITAAVNKQEPPAPTKGTPTDTGTPSTAQRSVAQTPSATSKPESPSVASPAVKSAPRMLRVVQTPKTETPAAAVAPTKEPTPTVAPKQPSRQPSVASINPPGTPSSEQVSISDNLSMTSTSQSRTNSPPPSGVAGAGKGASAPTRKTKTQQKKERQERAKAAATEEGSAAKKVEDEEPAQQQEAIVSRKKKTKKEKEPKARSLQKENAPTQTATGESTPTASGPPSPSPKAAAVKSDQPATKAAKPPSKPSTPTNAQPTPPAAQPPPMPSPLEPSPPLTPTFTATQLLAELKNSVPDLQKSLDSLFRNPASTHFKPPQPLTAKDLAALPSPGAPDASPPLTKADVDALLKGTLPAFRYGGAEGRLWDRGLVTPTGAHLRALTSELEQRCLELEKAMRELPEDLRFRPSKPQNETKFPSVDLEALRRAFVNAGAGGAAATTSSGRGVSVMEQMVQDGSGMKKGAFLVDEAGKYINEFVMLPATPPPPPPPPSASSTQQQAQQQQQAVEGAQGQGQVQTVVPSVDIAERQLNEARRMADEREAALRKVIKKNRKLFGQG